jgi:hypothetical protein
MNRLHRCAPSCAASLLLAIAAATPAPGQNVIVSGDVTPIFYLTDTPPNNSTPGNRQFFTNILDGGTSVRVRTTTFNNFAAPEANEFYNSLPGVSSSLFTGEVTPAQLAGADLLVMPFLNAELTTAETTAVAAFLNGGGDLFVTGEASVIANGNLGNSFVNALLADLGIAMNLVNSTFDTGSQVATGSQIVAHPLTAGVTAFSYGGTASVEGGQPLFRTIDLTPFISVGQIPEPMTGSIALILLGATATQRRYRRRRRNSA